MPLVRPDAQAEPGGDAGGEAVGRQHPVAVGPRQFLQDGDGASGVPLGPQGSGLGRQRRLGFPAEALGLRGEARQSADAAGHAEGRVEKGAARRVEVEEDRRRDRVEDVEDRRMAIGDAEDEVRLQPGDGLEARLLPRADVGDPGEPVGRHADPGG